MKHMTFHFHWTTSKVMAFLILGIGTSYAFYAKDGGVMTTAMTIAGGVIAVKTGSVAYTAKTTNPIES